ncbi:MAG TPA: efflux RND transporter permease subunit [Jatrophihabitans sp.]|nr:efflux RND transporter permease subunit [Jatrophihabitans sp.]
MPASPNGTKRQHRPKGAEDVVISAIVGFSVRFRVLVLAATLVLLGVGIAQLRSAPVDEYPDFAAPRVEVQAEALGLSAAEVEQLITVPLEQDLLNGVPWLDQITSESLPGLSTIDMVFTRSTNLLKARQMVQEHLTQAHALPQVGTPPVMIQPTDSAGRVLMVGLGAKHLSLVDLSILARWKIKPRLEGLPGVASVAVWGQRDRQLQVQVDPGKLRRYGVTLDQVVATTGNALWVSPLTFVEASTPGTGGFVDTASQRFGIQHITPITTAKTLSQVAIQDTGGRIVRLGQVSDVVEGHQPLIGDAVLHDSAGLMLVIQKFPGADTRKVSAAVERTLDEMRPGLAGITIDTSLYRPADYIDSALHNLGVRALLGLILLTVVLAGFLLSWRFAVLALTTTVTSLVAAGYVLYLRGATFDVMTLAGVAGAIGVVISESVAGAEVFRRSSPSGPGTDAKVVDGTRRVRAPLSYASLCVLAVPVPVLALDGVTGSFARSFLLTYLLTVVSALVVGFVCAPALGSLLWRPGNADPASPVLRFTQQLYTRLANPFVRNTGAVALSLAALALAGLALIPQVNDNHQTLPPLRDRQLTITWRTSSGTSLPEMVRLTARAMAQLRAVPGVAGVGGHVGRAVMADQPVDVDSADMWVTLKAGAAYGPTVRAVAAVATGYPGVRADVATYPSSRITAAESQTLSSPLVVRVYGPDLTGLATKAEQVRAVLARVPGVQRPQVAQQRYEPAIRVQVNLLKAERYGLTPGDIRRASATYFAGLPVGSLYEDQKIFDVVVWGVPTARRVPSDVANLLIDTPSHGRIPLETVADVGVAPEPTVIRHSDISRYLDVSAGVHGRDLDTVLRDVRQRLTTLSMPREFHAEVLSGRAPYDGEHLRVILTVVGTLVAVLLLLQLAFASWRLAVLTLLTVPVSAVGAVVVAPFVGGLDTLGPMLGALAVVALSLRNAVLLVRSYADVPASRRGELARGVVAVSRDQLVTVLLTALLVAAFVVPFAVGGVGAGTEVLQPFAVTCIGGVVTSTFFALFVLPGLYLRLAARLAPTAAEAPNPEA